MRGRDHLVAHVEAVNSANKAAMELYPKLAAIFKPLVGQRLVKVSGTELLKKVEDQLPDFPYNSRLQIYKTITNYSLSFTCKTCVNVPSQQYCVYKESTVYIGEMRDGVLMSI